MTRLGTLDAGRLQVVVLGPGYGESLVVRVPGAPPGWLLVDSLLTDRAGGPRCEVLTLLDELGPVPPDLVLLTHAHADHAGGMDLVVERFRDEALFGVLDLDLTTVASARVRAAAQGKESAAALRAIRQLPPDRRWDLTSGPVDLADGKVTVLHPSEDRLKHLLRLASIGPNRVSSALLVEWRDQLVLLGADLERPEWVSLLLADKLQHCNPVKVPHHGSSGAFDHTWAGKRADDQRNADRRMLVAPFDKHPKLPDIDHPKGLPALLTEVDEVHITSLPFRTVPPATGLRSLDELRTAREAGRATRPPLPSVLGTPTAPQVTPAEADAWLLADLSPNGACDVRGGAAHIRLTS